MIDREFAARFAADWIHSWNEHDLDRILSHYTDDFEMSSPRIATVANEASGKLRGKEAIRAYWARTLQLTPDLHFELIATLIGVDSITLCYNGVRGLSAEVFQLDQTGKIARAYAHYSCSNLE